MKTRIFYSLFVLLSLGNPILTESKKILNTKVVTQEESGLESQEKTVWVLNEFKTIRVLYKPEGKKSQFAKLVLETSGAYIPKLAEYLQAAPIAKVLTIRDLTDKTSARNEGSTVYLPFAFPDPELPIPAPLLYHEIGHWWFGQEPRWISEGVSSFLPIAMEKTGFHSIGELECNKINSWWGFRNQLSKEDFPLGDLSQQSVKGNGQDFSIYYEKTFKIQYLIYLELGGEKYRKFLISLMDPKNLSWHDYFIAPSKKVFEEKTKGVLSLLRDQKEIDWDHFLSGWIVRKGYTSQTKLLLKDSDGDSIVDFEEIVNKTNISNWDTDGDGMGDYAEHILGTNPNEGNKVEEFKDKIQKKGIIIDGVADDWEFIESSKILRSKVQNQKIPIIEFRYFLRDKNLYGMLRSEKPLFNYFVKEKDIYFFIADNSKSKERVGLGFKIQPNDVYGWEYERTKGNKKYIWGKVSHVFEFQIDISDHEDDELILVPLINGASGPSLGNWDYGDPIVIPIRK